MKRFFIACVAVIMFNASMNTLIETNEIKKSIEDNKDDNPPVVNNVTENTYNIYYEDNKEAVEERDFYKNRTEELESEVNKGIIEDIINKGKDVIFKNDYVEYDYSENY